MIYTLYEAIANTLYNLAYDNKLHNLEYSKYKKVLEFVPEINIRINK